MEEQQLTIERVPVGAVVCYTHDGTECVGFKSGAYNTILDENGKYVYMLKHEHPVTLAPPDTKQSIIRKVAMEATPDQSRCVWRSTKHGTTVGSDPEIFVLDGNGDVLPAFQYLPKKDKAVEVIHKQSPCGTAFYDGFQAEFTVRPSSCLGHTADYIREGLLTVLNAARAVDPAAKLSIASVVPIPQKVMEATPKEHFILGCSPSLNVYGEGCAVPEAPEMIPYRSAGWHMHFSTVGLEKSFPIERREESIKMLDRIIGVGMVPFAQSFVDTRRREMYGRAGEYRYGRTMEYRVPEVILGAHPATWNMWWDLARRTWWMGLMGLSFLWEGDDGEVREAINDSNVKLAEKIIHQNEAVFRRLIYLQYKSDTITDATMSMILNGVESRVKDPTDLYKNWRLGEVYGVGEFPGYGGKWLKWGTESLNKELL